MMRGFVRAVAVTRTDNGVRWPGALPRGEEVAVGSERAAKPVSNADREGET
jgi:hypothetical protein